MKFFLVATIDGTDFVIRTNCCKKNSYSRAALTVTVAFSNDLFDWRRKYLEITATTKIEWKHHFRVPANVVV